MSRLPALKSRDVERALLKMGFEFCRQKGSHRIFVKEDKMVVVPVHDRDLKKGTVAGIIKGTGKTPDEFADYL